MTTAIMCPQGHGPMKERFEHPGEYYCPLCHRQPTHDGPLPPGDLYTEGILNREASRLQDVVRCWTIPVTVYWHSVAVTADAQAGVAPWTIMFTISKGIKRHHIHSIEGMDDLQIRIPRTQKYQLRQAVARALARALLQRNIDPLTLRGVVALGFSELRWESLVQDVSREGQ